MAALKLPEREYKGLLNFVRERILKHFYGTNLLCTAANLLKTQFRCKLQS